MPRPGSPNATPPPSPLRGVNAKVTVFYIARNLRAIAPVLAAAKYIFIAPAIFCLTVTWRLPLARAGH
jgi:hypothetical protein